MKEKFILHCIYNAKTGYCFEYEFDSYNEMSNIIKERQTKNNYGHVCDTWFTHKCGIRYNHYMIIKQF